MGGDPTAGETTMPLGVAGTGIDLVEIPRIRRIMGKWRRKFTERVFLAPERRYCESRPDPCVHYAGRFAMKEAVAKAFGTGIGGQLGWHDIEVRLNPSTRAPAVILSRRGREFADGRGIGPILISLAHTRYHAVAQAVILAAHPREPDRESSGQ